MTDRSRKISKAAAAGILTEAAYFISVTLFLVTKTEQALTLWEIMTVAGALVMLMIFLVITEGRSGSTRTLMQISLSGTLLLTSAAHFTSIGVTRVLAARGVDIPDYYMIGRSPSYEMTLDYTSWGFFMGIAFVCLLLIMKDKPLKIMSGICAALCFAGFIGSFFAEYLWYPAPMGYGFGFLIMCIYLIRRKDVS